MCLDCDEVALSYYGLLQPVIVIGALITTPPW